MRLRDEENSLMASTSSVVSLPLRLYVSVLEVRETNSQPIRLAASTSAPSSGEAAW